tara:strand:- start:68 stop:241 length:174 start_codon:yes stop_codon:yes gene_type:complete
MSKIYSLKIVYDPDTDEVESIEEYMESDNPVFNVGDDSFEIPDDICKYIESDILGLA